MAESEEPVGRWAKHRELVLYTVAFVGLVALGQLWKGALSMILSPLWMLLIIWILPFAVERIAGHRR